MQTFYTNVLTPKTDGGHSGLVVLIATCKGTEPVYTNEVVRVQASSNYSKIYFKDGRSLVVAKVLYHFEELLKLHHFMRVHNSDLLNMRYIKGTQKHEGIKIELITGEMISVSRRMEKNVLNFLRGKVNLYDAIVA